MSGLYITDREGDLVCRHCKRYHLGGHFPSCTYLQDRESDHEVTALKQKIRELETERVEREWEGA